MLSRSLLRPTASAVLGRAASGGWAASVCRPAPTTLSASSASSWLCTSGARRGYAKPSRFGRKRVEVLEREREPASRPSTGNPSWLEAAAQEQQQRQEQQSQYGSAPASSFPQYAASRQRDDEQQQGTQWEAIQNNAGVVAHMQKVYATLAAGIGIAAGTSMFTMATMGTSLLTFQSFGMMTGLGAIVSCAPSCPRRACL